MNDTSTGHPDSSGRYEIRLKGHLGPRWAARFDGLTLTAQDDGTTVIAGNFADQAALHGLLRTLGDLGLPLVSVNPVGPTLAAAAPPTPTHEPR
jgi:hypothetical protein